VTPVHYEWNVLERAPSRCGRERWSGRTFIQRSPRGETIRQSVRMRMKLVTLPWLPGPRSRDIGHSERLPCQHRVRRRTSTELPALTRFRPLQAPQVRMTQLVSERRAVVPVVPPLNITGSFFSIDTSKVSPGTSHGAIDGNLNDKATLRVRLSSSDQAT
jgi:hypothetical protein